MGYREIAYRDVPDGSLVSLRSSGEATHRVVNRTALAGRVNLDLERLSDGERLTLADAPGAVLWVHDES